MDIQRALISKTLAERALQTLVERGIKEEFFPTVEHAAAFRWCVEYYRSYAAAPTGKAFKQNFPAYKLLKVEETLDWLIDELQKQRKFYLVDDVLFQATEIRKDGADPDEIISLYASAVQNIHDETLELRDSDIVKTWRARLQRYAELEDREEGALLGIPLGFPSIDAVTSGARNGQLITVIGEPKAGKSTALIRMAISAHEAGNGVLFVGFEMSNEEQEARHDAMRSRIPHERLVNGTLRSSEKLRLRKALKSVSKRHTKPFVLSQDVFSATTLSGLQAKVSQYQPGVDIMFVDGVYMMDDEQGEEQGSPRHLTNVTRGLKRMAQKIDIPIVITTQVLTWKLKSSRQLTGDSIGYSSSFAQDSDLVMGFENVLNRHGRPVDDEKRVRIVLSRNCARVDVRLRWDWQVGDFDEIDSEREDFEHGEGEVESDDGILGV